MASVISDDCESGGSLCDETAGNETANDVNKTETVIAETDENRTDNNNASAGCAEDASVAPAMNENDILKQIKLSLEHITGYVTGIEDTSVKTTREIREIHKLYHNEFANRLQSMQEELERYREIERGRVFDGILTELAKLYSNNSSMTDDVTDEKTKKRLKYLFLEMLQILENNGVSVQKSEPGDKRNTRHCQVVERIYTDRPELHDTVASSRSTGFYVDNRSFIKEMVDVYLYSEKINVPRQAVDELKITKEEN